MYQQMLSTRYEQVCINSLQTLGRSGMVNIDQLPYSIKILLESFLRNYKKLGIAEQDLIGVISRIAANQSAEIPFVPTRVIMQDASGVPALIDFVSLRQRLAEEGIEASDINPSIPVDLVIDHSVQVDYFGSETAFSANLQMEYERNKERYINGKIAHGLKPVEKIPHRDYNRLGNGVRNIGYDVIANG